MSWSTYDFAHTPVNPGSTVPCSLDVQLPGCPWLIPRDRPGAHPLLLSTHHHPLFSAPASCQNRWGYQLAPGFHWFTGFESLHKVKLFLQNGKDIKKDMDCSHTCCRRQYSFVMKTRAMVSEKKKLGSNPWSAIYGVRFWTCYFSLVVL